MKTKSGKSLHFILFLAGLILICFSILMFLGAVGMFVSHGNYNHFILKFSEYSFILWLPLMSFGILLLVISSFLRLIKK